MLSTIIAGVLIGLQEQSQQHVPSLEEQLFYAVVNYEYEKVKILIDQGADMHKTYINKYGSSSACALEIACSVVPSNDKYRINSKNMLQLLIEKGAKVNQPLPNNDFYPLQYAVGHANLGLVSLLLANGANVNSISNSANNDYFPNSRTPLIELVKPVNKNNFTDDSYSMPGKNELVDEVMQLLLEAGALPNKPGPEGDLPLQIVVYKGRINQVKLLIKHGADPNLRKPCFIEDLSAMKKREIHEEYKRTMTRRRVANPYYYTALHVVALQPGENKAEITKLLLNAGADPTLKDALGRTPLEIARNKNNKDVMNVLKNY